MELNRSDFNEHFTWRIVMIDLNHYYSVCWLMIIYYLIYWVAAADSVFIFCRGFLKGQFVPNNMYKFVTRVKKKKKSVNELPSVYTTYALQHKEKCAFQAWPCVFPCYFAIFYCHLLDSKKKCTVYWPANWSHAMCSLHKANYVTDFFNDLSWRFPDKSGLHVNCSPVASRK